MNKDFFIKNRDKIKNSLPQNSLFIVYSGKAQYWSGDQTHKFSVDKNFYYMTGLEEENYIYVYTKSIDEEIIFIERDNDDKYIKFSGHKRDKTYITNSSSLENILYLDEFENFIEKLDYKNISDVYIDMSGSFCDFSTKMKNKLELLSDNKNYHDVNAKFSEFRAAKEDCEIDNIKTAIEVTNKGIKHILTHAKECKYENQIEALFDYKIKSEGVSEMAFASIVASGQNATILHYEKNNFKIYEYDLVLVDLGVRHENYCSDISRTFPISGKFSDRQKLLYNIVLKVQKETMDSVKIGMTFKELNEVTKNAFIRELKEIGLIENEKDLDEYYYHSVSHPLGLDAHDNRKNTETIRERMVVTIEPGLYIEEEGIGIRIEDDILVTKEGYVNLSINIPKEADDIERIMQ